MKIFIIWLQESELCPSQLDSMHRPHRPHWESPCLHLTENLTKSVLTTKQAISLNTHEINFFILCDENIADC